MQRLLSLLIGPLVGFGVSALITIVGMQFLSREIVAPLAVGFGLAAVTYFSPTARRRKSLGFSLALGAAIALLLAITLRLFGQASA